MTALSLSFSTHRHSLILHGTSHPITCDGCYHARVVAGGESQLCVVVADQLLNRLFRSCGQMLSAIARLTLCQRHGAHPDWLAHRVRYPRGDIQFSKSLLNFFSVAQEGLNCYLWCGEEIFCPFIL